MKLITHLKGRTAMVAASAILSTSILGGALVGSGALPAYAQAPIQTPQAQTPASFRDIVKKVTPAVVNISTTVKPNRSEAARPGQGPGQMPFPEGTPFDEFFKRFFGENLPPQFRGPGGPGSSGEAHALGSGFIISPEGYVVTNNHVVENGTDILVILNDKSELKAEVVGTDPKTDLALLKVKSDKPLPYVAWGDSEKTEVGDWVLAVGNPFGLGGSVTAGIVSARGRDIQAGPFDDFLQIDAPINRGNSGGPSFNANGEVIGVNTAIFSPSGGNIGIGFAVPANMAKDVIAQLREHGSVERGWLGVSIQPVTDDIADSLGLENSEGALVASVQPDSPAAKAGLRPGDVILSFAGKPVSEMRTLPRLVADTKAGEQVSMSVWRDGKQTSLKTEVAKTPAQQQVASATSQQPDASGASLGVTVASLNEDVRGRLGIPDDVKGVVVVDVQADGPAASKGIQRGDVIARIGNTPVQSPEDLRKQVREATDGGRKAVLLLVNRQGEERFVAVPVRSA